MFGSIELYVNEKQLNKARKLLNYIENEQDS